MDGDVIPEHPDHVLGQAQHLGEAGVVHPVGCPAQRVTDEVSCCIHICRLHSHGVLSLLEHLRNVLQRDVVVGQLEGGEGCLATHVFAHQSDHLHGSHHVPESVRAEHHELVPGGETVVGDVWPGSQVGRSLVVGRTGVLSQVNTQGLLNGAPVPFKLEITEGSERGEDGEEPVPLDDVMMFILRVFAQNPLHFFLIV